MQLLVLKAGLSVCMTVSMLTVVVVDVCSSTNCERQSAALFLSPEIHLKVILNVVSFRLHLLTLLFAFFPLRTSQVVYDNFYSDFAPCR